MLNIEWITTMQLNNVILVTLHEQFTISLRKTNEIGEIKDNIQCSYFKALHVIEKLVVLLPRLQWKFNQLKPTIKGI